VILKFRLGDISLLRDPRQASLTRDTPHRRLHMKTFKPHYLPSHLYLEPFNNLNRNQYPLTGEPCLRPKVAQIFGVRRENPDLLFRGRRGDRGVRSLIHKYQHRFLLAGSRVRSSCLNHGEMTTHFTNNFCHSPHTKWRPMHSARKHLRSHPSEPIYSLRTSHHRKLLLYRDSTSRTMDLQTQR